MFDEVIHPLTNQVNFIYNGVILFINLFSVTLAMCSFCIRKFINNGTLDDISVLVTILILINIPKEYGVWVLLTGVVKFSLKLTN